MLTYDFSEVIVQPATFCNLDCRYCYLSTTSITKKMSVAVAERILKKIIMPACKDTIRLTWHGGEPLTAGIKHFEKLVQVFEANRVAGNVVHAIQTNATLITDAWCRFFIKYGFKVGISLDGNEIQNSKRVDRKGRNSYENIIAGAELLKKYGIDFGVISVVSNLDIIDPNEFIKFFVELGCSSLAINIEETEGKNESKRQDPLSVLNFWNGISKAGSSFPDIGIRELDDVYAWIDYVLNKSEQEAMFDKHNLIPSVAYDGSLVLLSPEFLGVSSNRYDFVVGNLLTDEWTIDDYIVRCSSSSQLIDYATSVKMCKDSCDYFGFCSGGWSANKYFENGTIASTETEYCRNMKQYLLDAVLAEIEERR